MGSAPLCFVDIADVDNWGQALFADVTFDVREGEFVLLVGRSGSGKSQLLRLACGLSLPRSGRILVKGRDVTTLPRPALLALRAEIGVHIETAGLLSNLSLFDNVALPLRYHGDPPAPTVTARVEALLEQLDLMRVKDHRPAEMSETQIHRGLLARALAHDPDLLLIDEPLEGQDAEGRAAVAETLTRLRAAKSVSLLYTTADVTEMEHLRDRVLVMKDGHVKERTATSTGQR